MTSETTQGPGTGAPEEPRRALEALAGRIAQALAPANETAPPPAPEPANSDLAHKDLADKDLADKDLAKKDLAKKDLESEADPAPPPAQEWPLAWLRLVEPEPPAVDDEAVAAVIAAEPADADGVAHAFGRVMAAALDPEPAVEADEAVEPAEQAGCAFYSVPVGEPPEGLSGAEADDALAAAAKESPAAPAEATAVPASEDPLIVSPVYAARRAARRAAAAAEAETAAGGQAGEGGLAAAAYIFYLAGFLLLPAVAGVLIAYNARRTAPAWLESHYLFLIRTFWIGLAGAAVAVALLLSGKLTLAGLVLGLLLVVWLEVRGAMGFIKVMKLRALSRPRSWLL